MVMRLFRRAQNKRGFTLTEAIITVAIIGGVMAVVSPFLTQGIRYFVLSRARLELQREARASMSLMTRFVREGQSSTIVIDRVVGQPPYSRIRFTRNTPTGSEAVSFYQSNKQLIHTRGTNHIQILSENLRYLAFAFPRSDDMGILSVSTTLEKGIYQGQTKALHMASEKVRVMNQ